MEAWLPDTQKEFAVSRVRPLTTKIFNIKLPDEYEGAMQMSEKGMSSWSGDPGTRSI
jgi:hypothetical protein